ncbi:MAG: hypothetical protein U5N26_06160 [Candidatus Marinimicrobia bacterium]|nr:hypothetical protein [Candidatus Neomarinimicrobiota bacterium]
METVLIRSPRRNTLCISSQVGCALGCVFCRTADMGFTSATFPPAQLAELVHSGQPDQRGAHHECRLSWERANPFANYDVAVLGTGPPWCLNHEQGPDIAARRVTFFHFGDQVPRIRRIRAASLSVRAGGSAAQSQGYNSSRNATCWCQVNHPLSAFPILPAGGTARTRTLATGTLASKYASIRDLNDGPEDAEALKNRLTSIPCKLNVIPFNETGGGLERPSDSDVKRFLSYLET